MDSDQPHEAANLSLDLSKVINELNWKPLINPKTTIDKTINLYNNQ
jgi:hypothetical protein